MHPMQPFLGDKITNWESIFSRNETKKEILQLLTRQKNEGIFYIIISFPELHVDINQKWIEIFKAEYHILYWNHNSSSSQKPSEGKI